MRLIAILILATFAAQPALAQQQKQNACAPVKPAQINITPTAAAVKYDYSKTLAQLQSKQTDTIDPYGFEGVTVKQAYMEGEIRIKPVIKLGNSTNQYTGMTCIWYESIDLPIEVRPTIVMAREVAADPCMRQATMEHEMKHVTADRKIVNNFARVIGQKIYKAMEERGFRAQPVPYQNAQDMANRMYTVISQVIEFEYKRMDLDRAEQQRAIDSLEEYERLSKLCPSFQQKMPAWASTRPMKLQNR